MKDLRVLLLSLALVVVLTACSDPEDNFAGSEYMPDMGHSLAMEANTYNYYYYNTWDKESTVELAKLVYPRTTVEGTVPRGWAANALDGTAEPVGGERSTRKRLVDGDNLNAISIPANGYAPYYYEDSDEGRAAAIAELIENPFPITEDGLARGENLYGIFCAICHGEAGNGLGYIYDEEQNPNAKYPAAPANFLNAEFLAASNGRYYNAIMHGYNVMGAYKDKMNYEERWQVIHYIRLLQAREAGGEYGPESNTFNPTFGTPIAEFEGKMNHHGGDGHGDDHGTGQMTDNTQPGEAAGSNTLKK